MFDISNLFRIAKFDAKLNFFIIPAMIYYNSQKDPVLRQ